VISPFAKANFVDHSFTTQTSVTRFIEDNWGLGQLGGGSFDAIAGSIDKMFDFSMHDFGSRRLPLDPVTGLPM
jgi:phospholipase C